jgi:hypothetical protein
MPAIPNIPLSFTAAVAASAFLVAVCTQAARPLLAAWRGRQPRERSGRSERETRDRTWAKSALVAVIVVIVALGLAAYAAAASYESVSGLAAQHNVPLHRWYPLSLDGGLVGVTLMNLALLWMEQPLWWLRWIARAFAFGTIAANALAGWPDPTGIMLRVWPSVLFVVVVEAAHAILMRHLKRKRQAEQPKRKERDRIPLARWFLARRSTFELWKRMKLWRIRSYSVAVRTELSRQQAVVRLAEHYAPGDWHHDAPQDLVWMLETGVRIDEALARVGKLITDAGKVEAAERAAAEAQARVAEAEAEVADGAARAQEERTRLEADAAQLRADLDAATVQLEVLRKRAAARAPKAGKTAPKAAPRADSAEDLTTELRALQILEAHPELRQPGMGSELGRRLGVSPGYGRKLHGRLTSEERPPDALQERAEERPQEHPGERS